MEGGLKNLSRIVCLEYASIFQIEDLVENRVDMYVCFESVFMCMKLWNAICDEIVAVRIGIRQKVKILSLPYEVLFSENQVLFVFD